jgi:hypothetical protein
VSTFDVRILKYDPAVTGVSAHAKQDILFIEDLICQGGLFLK